MRGEYSRNYRMILDAEESFARLVALGLWVKRPLTAWHYLIPGIFIFDILRRNQAISRYSAVFLFPRKAALDAAMDAIRGEDRKSRFSRAEEEIGAWLRSLNLFSETLQQAHRGQVAVLVEHYSRLLQADGDAYPAILHSSYPTLLDYQDFLQRLGSAEQEVDRAVAGVHRQTAEIWARLRAEQTQVEDIRGKEAKRIFGEKG